VLYKDISGFAASGIEMIRKNENAQLVLLGKPTTPHHTQIGTQTWNLI